MCIGRPVIVSNHVGCAQDLVKAYRNGLVFSAGNISALANCLQEVFSDKDRLYRWGEESKKIIVNYSYDQATQGLREALNYLGI